MAARGIDLLGDEIRPAKQGTTGGWLETGHLDELGHKLGIRLASQIDTELDTLVERIAGLMEAGWTRIRVVTDHGWLLMPGGLPYVAIPAHLTATRWSRCATVKGDAKPLVPVYAWQSASITAVSWRGMRCRVTVATNAPSVRVDLRLNWKQANTSIVASTKEVGPAGEASLTVADDAHEGAAATLVVVDSGGSLPTPACGAARRHVDEDQHRVLQGLKRRRVQSAR